MSDVEFFELSDPGCVAATNEDAVGHWRCEDGIAFAVADGGAADRETGALASGLAIDVLAREMSGPANGTDVPKRLRRALQEANLDLYNKVTTVPELRRMGTALTVSALVGGMLFAAHVGNCRLLLWRDRRLTQLTKDHTAAWEAGEEHAPFAGGARSFPYRHALTRCLGRELIVSIDALRLPVRPGDVLLQCSDGVHATLRESEMAELLGAHPPEAACRAMVRRAHEEGGEDNLSVQVAGVVACPPRTQTAAAFVPGFLRRLSRST